MKVLIADDSPSMRRLLEASLQGWGYEVVTAKDGTEAWAKLRSDSAPQIAILDWMMPGLTGPDVCRLVREQKTRGYTYILLLTSKGERQDIVAGLDSGADDYVTKPFDQHELEVRVRAGRRIVDLQAELYHVQEQLREQATRDALTGCWNRSTALEILARELARAKREKRHLGLLLLDLDHFKSINDTYGHLAGDFALKEVVKRMQSSIRDYDALGRYGGEEFLAILPGCDELCLLSHGERLRRAITDSRLLYETVELPVSASFGASSAPPESEFTVEQLIRAADDALYQAKRLGRNRVVYLPAETIDHSTPTLQRR